MARPKLDMERKAQILEALEAVVLQEGIARLTLSKVADRAGLPRSLVRYFAGNRDDLILMLFSHVMSLGEAMMDSLRSDESAQPSTPQMLDILLDHVFADEKLGDLVDELWAYAKHDEQVHERLAALYQRVVDELADSMKADGLGDDNQDRFDRAYCVVSMAFGAAWFSPVGLNSVDPQALRRNALGIMTKDSNS